ncbi:MAG: Uma2 family endonuclease [Gemmatimonadales bacterium]
MAMATAQRMSVEEFLALPEDGKRHELLAGQHIVSPTPRWIHQRAVQELYDRLRAVVVGRPDVELLGLPGDLQLGPADVVEPDLFMVPSRPGPRPQSWRDAPTPILVAEVLSPSTASWDRGYKRGLYLEAGVEQYWIVDLDARVVERWRHGDTRPEICDAELRFAFANGVAGSIDLPEYFAEVWR